MLFELLRSDFVSFVISIFENWFSLFTSEIRSSYVTKADSLFGDACSVIRRYENAFEITFGDLDMYFYK